MRAFFLGIDMGGTTTKAIVIDSSGRPLSSHLNEVPTGAALGPAHVAQQMTAAATLALQAAGVPWTDVRGATLATPGPAINGVLGKCPNLPKLIGADLRTALHRAIATTAGEPIPVGWANDANAGAYADWVTFAQPKGLGLIGLYPGTGLGAGYVSPRGDLITGEHGAGAELGHLPMPFWLMQDEEPWPCGCGRRGCTETGASIAGLKHQLPHALKRPEFQSHPLATEDLPMEKKVFRLRALAQEGDPLALHLFARQARVLAATLVMGQMAFDASVAVLGGGLTEPAATTPQFRDWFLIQVKTAYIAHAFDTDHPIEILLTSLGDMSQAVGAAQLARHEALKNSKV